MRDLHILGGTKKRAFTLEDIIAEVKRYYSDATLEGSMGSYHFLSQGEVVAEVWLCRDIGWWYRMKKPKVSR